VSRSVAQAKKETRATEEQAQPDWQEMICLLPAQQRLVVRVMSEENQAGRVCQRDFLPAESPQRPPQPPVLSESVVWRGWMRVEERSAWRDQSAAVANSERRGQGQAVPEAAEEERER